MGEWLIPRGCYPRLRLFGVPSSILGAGVGHVAEWLKAADCRSAGISFASSNLALPLPGRGSGVGKPTRGNTP
jgi:hypothetical protein